MYKNIHPCIVELKMTAHGERSKAATARRPEAFERQQQPVAILNFTVLREADRQFKCRVHKLDAEVEYFHRGNEPFKPILRPSAVVTARFERSEPGPIGFWSNQLGSSIEEVDSDGD